MGSGEPTNPAISLCALRNTAQGLETGRVPFAGTSPPVEEELHAELHAAGVVEYEGPLCCCDLAPEECPDHALTPEHLLSPEVRALIASVERLRAA